MTLDWGSSNWSSFDSNNVVLSDCRDLVEVQSGEDYLIRRFIDNYPQYCWRLPGELSSVQYQSHVITRSRERTCDEFAPSGQSIASIPIFYAVFPYCYSPYDFSVQPKYLNGKREALEDKMQAFYNQPGDCLPVLEPSQVIRGIVCACNVRDDIWERCRLVHVSTMDVIVRLVDRGHDILVSRTSLRPLMREFGVLPPLALRCRLKDVFVNDLEKHRVDDFHRMLDNLQRIVRVELTNLDEPYLVNLYHPTIEGANLATTFYRPPDSEEREKAKQRKFEAHVRRMANEESDMDDDEGEYEDDFMFIEGETRQKYVKTLDRANKVHRYNCERLLISHVENSRMIFVHDEAERKRRNEMEETLDAEFGKLPLLPLPWHAIGTACVLLVDGRARRATITEIRGERAEFVLVDYGRILIGSLRLARALPAHYRDVPFVAVVSLYGPLSRFHPHPTETSVLRQLLSGENVMVSFETESRSNPPRGRISRDGVDILRDVWSRLSSRGVRHPITDLALPSPIAPLLVHTINSRYIHRLFPPPCLLKGKHSEDHLPQEDNDTMIM